MSNLSTAEAIMMPPAIDVLQSRPALRLIQGGAEQTSFESVAANLLTADTVPELAAAKQQAAERFSGILRQNRKLLFAGQTSEVPLPVDALGTARQVVDAKRQHGKHSKEYRERFEGLVLDSSRLLHEAVSKNNPEYFEEILQELDMEAGGYFSHGLSINDTLVNGISPTAHLEELGRRGEEFGEEATYVGIGMMIGRLGLNSVVEKLKPHVGTVKETARPSIDVYTVSECADYAHEEYRLNPNGSHSGFAPAINKLMLRGVHFRDDAGNRWAEQAALDGTHIDHKLILEVMAEATGKALKPDISKTELLGTQFMGVNIGGVREMVKKLDDRAGEQSGKNLFYGREVPADHPKDYQAFEREAAVRQKKLEPMPMQLANMLINLHEAGVDAQVATDLTDRFLKQKLFELAQKRPELAASIFDQATADGLAEVAQLEKQGRSGEADVLRAWVEANAPEISYCGAGGNCGTERVMPGSPAAMIAAQLGLKGDIVHNIANPCTDCGEMSLHHDMEGNSACIGCGARKLNGQEVEHGSTHKDD